MHHGYKPADQLPQANATICSTRNEFTGVLAFLRVFFPPTAVLAQTDNFQCPHALSTINPNAISQTGKDQDP